MAKFFTYLAIVAAAIFMLVTGAKAEVFITIDKSEQRMYVETPTDDYVWKVSTARKGFRTPIGGFQPYMLKTMHYSSKYNNAPMPHSIFFFGGYAIHGTNDLKRLGQPASHGCIRLSPQNARWLFQLVKDYGKQNTFIEIVE